MKESYHDLTSRLGQPLWWDEAGVPRYDKFRPGMSNSVYAKQVALVLIQCQRCESPFEVALSWSELRGLDGVPDLKAMIADGSIHYGDPPNIGCCYAGPTMNCDDIKVLEFWELENMEWVRRPEFEIPIAP